MNFILLPKMFFYVFAILFYFNEFFRFKYIIVIFHGMNLNFIVTDKILHICEFY